ncbi:MAG TPA: UDP-N-acetylglucosamine 1-carboxyvinyltransferase [Candidatus Saccharimonadales bacterium]|nr:UDP-N-acetylglucosamine 1-carboxyvinyltransferase [Candidatus Saccharimonadales bacterium]
MEKFVIKGGNALKGTVQVNGAKNAALKVLVGACLTSEKVVIHNVPLIADLFVMVEIMKELGADVVLEDHTVTIQMQQFAHSSIPLDKAAQARTSSMFMAPLLARTGEAIIPNPGGCRLGARPIDRTVEGVATMNVNITYHSEDGYFHAKTDGLKATTYHFLKNTHTGTETMILSAALATGTTVLTNAAEEPEIDDLIALINAMGGDVKRTAKREITIKGVEKLHGCEFTISPDRIEVATFAIAAVITGGDVFILDAHKAQIDAFMEKFKNTGAGYEEKENGIRFFSNGTLKAVDVTTGIFPEFLTDWQAPWAVLMTQATGTSTIHETVFENKLGYVHDLERMGATVELFSPEVDDREAVYNFNLDDDKPEYFHAVKITGPTKLHNAVMTTLDIRAGAAIVLAALIAKGTSTIFGIEKLDRGYEAFEARLTSLGADIKRVEDDKV